MRKELDDTAKTRREPETRPGNDRGRMIRENTTRGLAPSVCAARIRERSMFSSAAWRLRTMKTM